MADNRKYQAQSSRAKHRESEVPNEIPGFLIGDEIGRGSFAVVYAGVNAHTKQKVAIKAVIKDKLTNKLFQNLQDEINILKQIRHGNVVGLVDCISTNDYIFLVMQYCAEGDLSVYIKSKSKASNQDNQQIAKPVDIRPVTSSAPSPAPERFLHPKDGGLNEWVVRSFLGQLADALQFLRSHSIIHRDIKPQNLLLHPSSSLPYSSHGETPPPGMTFTSNKMGATHEQSSGAGLHRHVPSGIPILRVADFGFARVLETNSSLAETLCGSPLYMAPEILRYEKYDAKADLWSVGAVLYEMAVGKPPFRAQNHVELLRKIEKSEDKIVFPDDKFVARDIKELIKCLLKRNPIERISFSDFFRIADEVSLVGILAPPKQVQRTKSSQPASLSSTRINSQQIPSRTNSESGGLPKPPSTSSLPIPTSPSHTKPRRSITLNPFEGEQGAFIIDKASTLTRHNSTNTAKLLPSGTKASKAPIPQLTNAPTSATQPGYNAPSPSVLPLPSTGASRPTVPTFPAKYVIVQGGCTPGSSPQVAVGVKTKDYANIPGPKPANSSSTKLDDADDFGKEYVVVEKRSVEINSLVDDLASSPLKPMSLTRRMSRGFMPRPTHPGLSGSPHQPVGRLSPPSSALATTALGVHHPHTTPNPSFPPQPNSSPSPPSSGTHPMMITNIGRSSPSQNYHYNGYPSSPRSFDSGGGGGGIGSLPIVGKYFPQSYNGSGHSPRSGGTANDGIGTSYFSFPNSPLARAIMSSNAALNSRSLKPIQHQTSLFPHTSTPSTSKAMVVGTSHSQRPPSTRYSIDSVEAELMNELEKFASKVLVILQFADEKLAKILPPTPSSTSLTPQPMTAASYSPPTSVGAFAPLPKNSPNHLSKTSSEGTASSSLTATKVEKGPGNHKLAAGEAMVLYIKALAFLDKGIRHAVSISTWRKDHQGGTGFSPDVTFAIEWMRNKFNEVFDKAEFAKSKSPDQMLKNGIYAEKLIYDRALEKSRSAAVNELMGEHSIECELEYETSLWMLYSLLDPTMKEEDLQEDEDDREMIERFVVSIKTRLTALRRKMVSGT